MKESTKKQNETDVELDPIETAKAMINSMFEQQTLYFELVQKVTDKQKQTSAISANMMKLSMTDQIKMLKLAAQVADLSDELCDKYGFEIEEKE